MVDGYCVFRNRRGRGCGIHAYCLENQIDYHILKPTFCWLYPLTVDAGALIPQAAVLDKSLVCVDQGPNLYQAQRDELAYLFGSELTAELDAMQRELRSSAALAE